MMPILVHIVLSLIEEGIGIVLIGKNATPALKETHVMTLVSYFKIFHRMYLNLFLNREVRLDS